MSKKTAVLDLTGCKYWGDLHQRIKKALDFPEYYGQNWSAFEDCLRIDCPVEYLTVIGENTVAEDLKPSIKMMNEIMEEVKQAWADSETPFEYEIID